MLGRTRKQKVNRTPHASEHIEAPSDLRWIAGKKVVQRLRLQTAFQIDGANDSIVPHCRPWTAKNAA